MADPLRERLLALVEEWREEWRSDDSDGSSTLLRHAEQVAALLAESEPCGVQECKDLGKCACFREPNHGKTHYQGDDCPGGHASVCGYCGASCEACERAGTR